MSDTPTQLKIRVQLVTNGYVIHYNESAGGNETTHSSMIASTDGEVKEICQALVDAFTEQHP